MTQGELPALTVREEESGAFVTLSKTLKSPTWRSPVAFAALWAALPDFRLKALHRWSHPLALEIGYAGHSTKEEWHAMVYGIPAACLPAEPTDDHVAQWLDAHYPWLAGSGASIPNRADGISTEHDGRLVNAGRSWRRELQPADSPEDFVDRNTTVYRMQKWAFPVVGEAGGPTHPLLLWWALLYGLSMRARYAPEAWLKDLDVDKTEYTVWLEEALDMAIDTVPLILLHALEEAVADG